jgi:hypothetical protein
VYPVSTLEFEYSPVLSSTLRRRSRRRRGCTSGSSSPSRRRSTATSRHAGRIPLGPAESHLARQNPTWPKRSRSRSRLAGALQPSACPVPLVEHRPLARPGISHLRVRTFPTCPMARRRSSAGFCSCSSAACTSRRSRASKCAACPRACMRRNRASYRLIGFAFRDCRSCAATSTCASSATRRRQSRSSSSSARWHGTGRSTRTQTDTHDTLACTHACTTRHDTT